MPTLDSGGYGPNNAEFWTKKGDQLTVVGDFLGRLPAVEMLAPRKNEAILDAGCGAGFVSRMIARSGARVYGCDKEESMLSAAQRAEKQSHLGVQFKLADIGEHLPYLEGAFDAISCVGVLIHLQPEECARFFLEAYRVLKPGGRIVISVTHPELYGHTEKYRAEENPWLRHEPIGSSHKTGSRPYREFYKDNSGNIFQSNVWLHSVDFLNTSLQRAGFQIEREQTMDITNEALKAAGQSGEAGYPGYYQVLGRKPEPIR